MKTVFRLIEEHGLTLHGDIEHFAEIIRADERKQVALDKKAENARELGLDYEPVARYCCHSCFKASSGMMLDRMILCPQCGNKRCSKASDHRLDCTSSNDPGQPGSIYTTPPAAPVEPDHGDEWVGLTDEEMREFREEFWLYSRKLLQATKAKLKEKNT
jgi:DNA-directed RNA polymerase subunit RPC12/RpoP